MEPLQVSAELTQTLLTVSLGIQRLELAVDEIKREVGQIGGKVHNIDTELRDHTLDDSRIQTNIHNQLATLQEDMTQRRGNRIPQYALVLSVCSFALTTFTTLAGVIIQFVKQGGPK